MSLNDCYAFNYILSLIFKKTMGKPKKNPKTINLVKFNSLYYYIHTAFLAIVYRMLSILEVIL